MDEIGYEGQVAILGTVVEIEGPLGFLDFATRYARAMGFSVLSRHADTAAFTVAGNRVILEGKAPIWKQMQQVGMGLLRLVQRVAQENAKDGDL